MTLKSDLVRLGSHLVPGTESADLVLGSGFPKGKTGQLNREPSESSARSSVPSTEYRVEGEVLTATIVRGKKTNRVRVPERRRTRVPARSPRTRSVTPTDPSPQRATNRYKADRTAERGPTTVIAVSLPASDLCAMDDLAERLRMSRSHVIREAVRVFAANTNKPERP